MDFSHSSTGQVKFQYHRKHISLEIRLKLDNFSLLPSLLNIRNVHYRIYYRNLQNFLGNTNNTCEISSFFQTHKGILFIVFVNFIISQKSHLDSSLFREHNFFLCSHCVLDKKLYQNADKFLEKHIREHNFRFREHNFFDCVP